jgi:hypothetical protein
MEENCLCVGLLNDRRVIDPFLFFNLLNLIKDLPEVARLLIHACSHVDSTNVDLIHAPADIHP